MKYDGIRGQDLGCLGLGFRVLAIWASDVGVGEGLGLSFRVWGLAQGLRFEFGN